jgi:hypothetical protein
MRLLQSSTLVIRPRVPLLEGGDECVSRQIVLNDRLEPWNAPLGPAGTFLSAQCNIAAMVAIVLLNVKPIQISRVLDAWLHESCSMY